MENIINSVDIREFQRDKPRYIRLFRKFKSFFNRENSLEKMIMKEIDAVIYYKDNEEMVKVAAFLLNTLLMIMEFDHNERICYIYHKMYDYLEREKIGKKH